MADIAHAIVRRAAHVTRAQWPDNARSDDDILRQTVVAGGVILGLTTLLYLVVVSLISYTYGDLVATLSMIESPQTDVCIVEEEASDAEKLLPKDAAKDPEILLVSSPPITAKFRTAIRHLRAVAGPFARFRGLQFALLYHILFSILISCFRSVIRLPSPVAAIIASLLLCRFHMAWTHSMISMPSSKRFHRRLPKMCNPAIKQLLLPTAIWAIAQQLCIGIPSTLLAVVQEMFQNPGAYGPDPETVQKLAVVQSFGVVLVFFATVIGILVPAEVTLKRIEASLLDGDENTIVPFDRTFAGTLKPLSLGGSGRLSVLNAWATFSQQARLRLIKIYAKVFAMQVAAGLFFAMLFIGELRMIAGSDFQRLVDVAHRSFKGEL